MPSLEPGTGQGLWEDSEVAETTLHWTLSRVSVSNASTSLDQTMVCRYLVLGESEVEHQEDQLSKSGL